MSGQITVAELLEGALLTRAQSEEMFGSLVRGEMDEVEMAALLVALRMRGETPEILAGAARALQMAATSFDPGRDVADSCGTGGDGSHTLNISTAVALVAAEMGVPMVKHGNRSVSSRCGSADVLERLGVKVEASPAASRRALDQAGICFLFAPQYHAGIRHAARVRRVLGVRTIMNLLGPLVNPARPTWQLVGVYEERWCRPMAATLGLLGCRSAMVVHGNGLDELALHGATHAALLRDGVVSDLEFTPQDAGLREVPRDALQGGDADENAEGLRALLQGRGGEAHQAVVALNTAALLVVSGHARDLRSGVEATLEVLASNRAWLRLQRWIEVIGHD